MLAGKVARMKVVQYVFVVGALVALSSAHGSAESKNNSGETRFTEHCAACHSDGGNLINPEKSLFKIAREKHGIKSADDIVKLIRNPGEGMIPFDQITLTDEQAHEIADYIIRTFK
jgi:cytochrome c6